MMMMGSLRSVVVWLVLWGDTYLLIHVILMGQSSIFMLGIHMNLTGYVKFSIFFPKVGCMLDDYHLSWTFVLLIINVLYPVANMLTIFFICYFFQHGWWWTYSEKASTQRHLVSYCAWFSCNNTAGVRCVACISSSQFAGDNWIHLYDFSGCF